MKRNAFTLVELLVVITIITVLIAILLPALSAAREAARTVVCASNVRSQVFAAIPYANDHDFFGPGAGQSNPLIFDNSNKIPAGSILYDDLHPYLGKDDEIWRCPADEFYYHDQYNKHFASFSGSNDATSYSNGLTRKSEITFQWGVTDKWKIDRLPIHNEAWRVYHPSGRAIKQASKQPFTADASWWRYKQKSIKQIPHPGHTFNVSFLDGHCAQYKAKLTGNFWDMGPARIDW